MKWTALLLVLCVGCVEPLGPKPEPEPQPTPASETKIERAARKAVQSYAAGLSKSFTDAAEAEYTDADKANAALATRNKQARTEAFQPIDAILDDNIGGDKWDSDRAAKLFGELGDAFGKVAK